MSKAANHQSIRREDFLRTPHASQGGGGSSSSGSGSMPSILNLPSLADDTADDDVNADDMAKIQPINVGMLKEFMQKKLQRQVQGRGGGDASSSSHSISHAANAAAAAAAAPPGSPTHQKTLTPHSPPKKENEISAAAPVRAHFAPR